MRSHVKAGNTKHRELDRDSERDCSQHGVARAQVRHVSWLDVATFVLILGASRLVSRIRAHNRSVRRETHGPASTSAGPSETQPAATLTRHLGLPVSLINWSELENWTSGAVARGEGQTVFTIAPYQVYLSRSDSRYASVIERAALVLVDGNGVRFALSVAGIPIKGRLTGREVVQRVFSGVMLSGFRIAVVGSLPASQEALVGTKARLASSRRDVPDRTEPGDVGGDGCVAPPRSHRRSFRRPRVSEGGTVGGRLGPSISVRVLLDRWRRRYRGRYQECRRLQRLSASAWNGLGASRKTPPSSITSQGRHESCRRCWARRFWSGSAAEGRASQCGRQGNQRCRTDRLVPGGASPITESCASRRWSGIEVSVFRSGARLRSAIRRQRGQARKAGNGSPG